MRKTNAGFTLVELIVSIAASALVIGAALSFMLFGLRMDNAANKTVNIQSDSRIIMRALENIASEGEIGEIKTYDDETEHNGVKWELYPKKNEEEEDSGEESIQPILTFNLAEGTICGKNNVVIIDGVAESALSYNDNILSCEITTESGEKYASSVYCRIGITKVTLAETEETIKPEDVPLLPVEEASVIEQAARERFISIMFEQYGSTGIIEDKTVLNGYEFATWYWAMNLRNNSEIWTANPEKVPWCAIFVSWALNKTVNDLGGLEIVNNGERIKIEDKPIPQNIDALVDNVMWYQFGRKPSIFAIDTDNNAKFGSVDDFSNNTTYLEGINSYASLGTWEYLYYENEEGNVVGFDPKPGDLVFFENDDSNDRADHLGVVLYIEGSKLFVVEGNHNDTVGIFEYVYDENLKTYTDGISQVIGYGVINWDGLLPRVETNGSSID